MLFYVLFYNIGYGDTIVASNPFDDTPPTPSMSHMNPMNHVNKHMGVGPCMSPAAPMMGSISPCHIVGSPMGCGPPVGSPINCGPPLGNCSPMGASGSNANCGPVGSPHTSCNNRQVNRSPLVCTPMSTSSVMSNSPMNVNSVLTMNRSPSSLGSPLSSVMASNVRGNSPLDCGLGMASVGSQKGSPMSVMSSHNMSNINCGSPMGSPSNVPHSNCNNNNMIGSPITSPLNSVPCSMSGGSDLGINLNNVMNRSPMNGPPNAVNTSMMCSSSMRGPSPGSLNGPMNINCNPNSSMVNIGPKSEININDLALRENCGPGHLPMKANNAPGSCGMPMNSVSCTRPPDITGMQCGPLNSSHCNSMMSNQCGPGLSNMQCMGSGINRPQCPPGMGMNMGNPYDGMNPQCRPNLNRCQFPRGMANVHYGGPNSMNGPISGSINGPINGPLNSHGPMNGPNMNNMCGPSSDMNNLSCIPNNNANNMQCIGDSSMNNPQCMSNSMNQCSAPNSMFNSQYNPFDVNSLRCSPNLHFNSNDMNMNNNFYRSNVNSGSCMPNPHPSMCTSSNDVLNAGDNIMNTGQSKNNNRSVDSDIASVVCGITNENADDLNLIGDNLLRENKSEDRKPIKDFGGRILMNDENGENKEDDVDNKPNKHDLDSKIEGDLKIESKRENDTDKNDGMLIPNPNTTTITSCTTSLLTTSTCTSTTSTPSASITTTSVTVSNNESSNMNEDNENNSCMNNSGNKSNDNEDEYVFKSDSETQSNTSANMNSNINDSDSITLDNAAEDKIKEEPADKRLENEFNDDEKERDIKNDIGNDTSNHSNTIEDANNDGELRKENNNTNSSGPNVKMEADDFYEGNMKNPNDCSNGNGANTIRGNATGFTNGNMISGAPSQGNYNIPSTNDVASVLNTSSTCMNDSLCGSPMLPNMNRSPMPNAMNHPLNYPNRSMAIGKVSYV